MGPSPGRASNAVTGGQVVAAASKSMPSTSLNIPIGDEVSKQSNATLPNLFAPDHIPTLFTRIQSISKLLIQASNDVNSLSVPQADSLPLPDLAKAPAEAASIKATSRRPDVTMGAMSEDDLTSGYEAAFAISSGNGANVKRTELALSIVRESQDLRDAFQRAQAAINDMEGGEMDIEEQEALISILQDYRNEQNRVSNTFTKAQREDVTMNEV